MIVYGFIVVVWVVAMITESFSALIRTLWLERISAQETH